MIIKWEDLPVYLRRFDDRKYGYYKKLYGLLIDYRGIRARFTHIQSDPYAPPSIMELFIPRRIHGLRIEDYDVSDYPAITDQIYRLLYSILRKYRVRCGSGYSCYLGIPKPSPIIIQRSAVEISNDYGLVVRFYIGLPAHGRRIPYRGLNSLLHDRIAKITGFLSKLYMYNDGVRGIVEYYRDYLFIKKYLRDHDYIGFIANNSVLPRESSISDKPLKGAVPFSIDEEYSIRIKLPSGRVLEGLVIRSGVTIITGGGYHGKTTLLNSLLEGIYPHVPGDGREFVVCIDESVYVRAEDGRFIHGVDISGFIKNLPSGIDTTRFYSSNASGSTSMAASISEAVEAGVKTIFIDEDTSATNLLYKDEYMAKLLYYDPITPLSQIIRDFTRETGISLLIVSSASSILLRIADTIILMKNYEPKILEPERITGETHSKIPAGYEKKYVKPRRRYFKGIEGLVRIRPRKYRIIAKYRDGEVFEIDTRINPRIKEATQTKTITEIIRWISKNNVKGYIDEIIELINEKLGKEGFKAFTQKPTPDMGWVNGIDVAWVLNRIYKAKFT